jgi:hypothetical protein
MYDSRVFAITPTGQYGNSTQQWIRATAWAGSSSSWTIYNPGTTLTSATIYAARDNLQAGSLDGHAVIWSSPSSHVDLHVPAYNGSEILAMDGAQQAGNLYEDVGTLRTRAVVWSGTAESAVVLHPAGASWSSATGVAAGQQCGYVWFPAPNDGYKAVLWSGSAQSMTYLHPAGAQESQALGMAAGQQVGWTHAPGQNPQAAMWSGTAASYVDMNPPGAAVSKLLATCGSAQVGWASTAEGFVGGIWFGSAASFVPLSLGPDFQVKATSVAERNGTYYVGGYALDVVNGGTHAWMWVGVPAPGSASLLALAGLLGGRRRR